MHNKAKKIALGLISVAAVMSSVSSGLAAELNFALGSVGNELEMFRKQADEFEKNTGNKITFVTLPQSTTDRFQQISLWLSQGNEDIDAYMTDIIWAPQIANHLIDLTDLSKDVVGEHFESVISSQTVDGRLVALPLFTDAPALYYRKDLLKKYGADVPKTWDQLKTVATDIMDKERAAGNARLYGFVFQGKAYEGLTCDGLEWIYSNGGGTIVEADGTISINNPKAAEALDRAASWVGGIAPKGVTTYTEEESRGVWQEGNAVFMRNWPYAYGLGNSDESKVKGLFEVAPLPSGEGGSSAATLGGWNIAGSKYSKNQDALKEFILFLASKKAQKERAVQYSYLPTVVDLYNDADILAAAPFIGRWKDVFMNSVARPSAPTQTKYNTVSTIFFKEVNAVLTGDQTGAKAVEQIESKIKRAMR